MKKPRFRPAAWTFAIVALAGGLAGCNGSGDPGNTTAMINNTPSTQAAVHELVDAFAATLNGAQQVPMRASSASGSGTVVVNGTSRQMTAVLTTTGVAGTDAALHQGQPGANGPIMFLLAEAVRGSGTWTATATLTEAQYTALKAGEFYFNVRSLAFANGEIRGQVTQHLPGGNAGAGSTATGSGTAATGAGGFISPIATSTGTFLAALRGTQVLPPTTSTALGSATILVNPASHEMMAAVMTSGIAGTAVQLHAAPTGANGPAVISFAQAPAGSGAWMAQAILSEEQYEVLKSGNMYLLARSAAFPEGELRGQVLPQQISLTGITGVNGTFGADTPAGSMPTGTGTTGTGTTGIGTTGIGTTGASPAGSGTLGTGAVPSGSAGAIPGGTGTGTGTAGLLF